MTDARSENLELIFAFVAPMGVDLDCAEARLKAVLIEFGYSLHTIRLSEFLHADYKFWEGREDESLLDKYIGDHQQAGNDLRQRMKRKDALALVALHKIAKRRAAVKAGVRNAFLIRQLKTPEEVDRLRSVYGERFVVLGITAPLQERVQWLAKAITASREGSSVNWTNWDSRAKILIETDDVEMGKEYGQNVSATFPLSDFFAVLNPAVGETGRKRFEDDLRRFLSILFGKTDTPPTNEEFLMFQAHAASYQSADRSRQVGAVIASLDGSVVAVGRNDDPKVGGGVTATVSVEQVEDPALGLKQRAVADVLAKLASVLKPEFASTPERPRVNHAMALLEGSRLLGMNEFNRMVHAEMAALTDAALRGVAVGGQVMFCTTFPCQNCAKHLMAAGIRALYYTFPYPKSLVKTMYAEEYEELTMLSLDSPELRKRLDEGRRGNPTDGPAKFLVFSYLGVAPRRYVQLFTMPIRKLADGSKPPWVPQSSRPRIGTPMIFSTEHENWEPELSKPLEPMLKVVPA